MKIYPAIDLMSGEAVRLTKGDFNTKEVFSSDVLRIKADFLKQGAEYLHIVDLDGARHGTVANFNTVKSLTGGIFIELGGGIRDEKRIEDYLNLGVNRVILGTIAVKDFDFTVRMVKKYGDKIAVGVDALDNFVAVSGWEKVSKADSFDFVRKCADVGVRTVIYTDIATDGAMKGTNLAAFETLSRIDGINIIASGGITDYNEIALLRDMGIHGAILGKALYKGKMDLKEAIKIAANR